MQIVIVAAGTWGDVRPNTVLGQGLQEIGYEVTLVASENFRDWVYSRGLDFKGLNFNIQEALDSLTNSTSIFDTIGTMRSLGAKAVEMGQELADIIPEADVLFINEVGLALVNGVVEKYGTRVIHINMQPYAPTREFSAMLPPLAGWIPIEESKYNRWAGNFIRRSNWWMMGKYGNQIRKDKLGMPKQKWSKHQKMLETIPSLMLVSPHVISPPSDWGIHHQVTGFLFDEDTEWEAPQALLDFLAAGEKPIYIGFGSMRDRKPEETTHIVLEAIERSQQRAILLSGWAGIGQGNLPDNVYLLDYAPHTWLFPRMAAVIHHGGAGTTAAGLSAGVPSVIVPIIADQPFWGRRIHELGVGAKPIPHAKLSVDALADAIQEITNNESMQQEAKNLSQKIASDNGLKNAVAAIQAFLK